MSMSPECFARTSYHMRALVNLNNGASFTDADHTFNTGNAPATSPIQTSTTSGGTPEPGVELFDTIIPHTEAQLFATDLQGNVLWTYRYEGSAIDAIQAARPLPNGHFLLLISFASSLPTTQLSNLPGGTVDVIREVDLAGNIIREVSLAQLEQSLTAQGYSFTLQGFHHDVLPLPNGHIVHPCRSEGAAIRIWSVIREQRRFWETCSSMSMRISSRSWVWNTFDHLDVNRHPMNFPDWTHGNAILYSADDHDLLFSMRHQNWIVKIDYQDGSGSGDILWRLGPGEISSGGRNGSDRLVLCAARAKLFHEEHESR